MLLKGLSLALIHSSTNMLKSVWPSKFQEPLVHKNISNILEDTLYYILKPELNLTIHKKKQQFLCITVTHLSISVNLK